MAGGDSRMLGTAIAEVLTGGVWWVEGGVGSEGSGAGADMSVLCNAVNGNQANDAIRAKAGFSWLHEEQVL